MQEVPAEDAGVVLDDLAAQADRLASQRILVRVDPGNILAVLECRDRRVRNFGIITGLG